MTYTKTIVQLSAVVLMAFSLSACYTFQAALPTQERTATTKIKTDKGEFTVTVKTTTDQTPYYQERDTSTFESIIGHGNLYDIKTDILVNGEALAPLQTKANQSSFQYSDGKDARVDHQKAVADAIEAALIKKGVSRTQADSAISQLEEKLIELAFTTPDPTMNMDNQSLNEIVYTINTINTQQTFDNTLPNDAWHY